MREAPRGFEPLESAAGTAWKRVDFLVEAGAAESQLGCGYFDTETTGLSYATGTLVFAAALAIPAPGGIEMVQLFLAEPGHEPAFLEALAHELQACQSMATYNGRRFDVPILRNRWIMAGMPGELPEPTHVDVLDLARPLLKARLGSCALRAVESGLLRFEREEELPSYLVPEAYFSYLRRGSCAELEAALAHNRQDVISLYHLHRRLLLRLEGKDHSMSAVERLCLGRYFLKQGRRAAAARSLRQAVEMLEGDASVSAAVLLAALLARRGAARVAEHLLARLQHEFPRAAALAIARARLLEWRLRNPAAALGVVEAALEALPASGPAYEELLHRRSRLQRKVSPRLVLPLAG